MRGIVLPLTVSIQLLVASIASAQIGGSGKLGPFIPDRNTTLNTAWNGGVFEFTKIHIPKWVTVKLVGPNPGQLFSQGDVIIEGRISADGEDGAYRTPGRAGVAGFGGGAPGLTSGQPGQRGMGESGGSGGFLVSRNEGSGGAGAGHRKTGPHGCPSQNSALPPGGKAYGSADPLDLRGGSGGGGDASDLQLVTRGCLRFSHARLKSGYGGGGGGGAFAIIANGLVTISGIVSADGGDSNGPGSGGTIAIRALSGIRVTKTGKVVARGGKGNAGADGFVRLDTYGRLPAIEGEVDPVPTSLGLPDLAQMGQAGLGGTLRMRVVSIPGDDVALFLAPRAGEVKLPWGTLKLDPATMVFVAIGSTSQTAVDPRMEFKVPVPKDSKLLGVPLFWQGFVFKTKMPSPKLTNLFITSIIK